MEQGFGMKKKTAETSERRKSRGICYFLLSLLEDESYPYVQWTNKEKGEFQIHWVHASSGTWELDTDAETFRLWAMAKGKLEGRETKNKTWKANFRCAMKSRPELQEIKLPKDSAQRKSTKHWKFVDIDIVRRYQDGRSFDWHRIRTKSIAKKSPRVQPLRSAQNKTTPEKEEEKTVQHTLPYSCTIVSNERQTTDTPEEGVDNNLDTYGAGLLQIIDCHVEDRNSEAKSTSLEGRLQIDIGDDNDLGSYGVGLLKILGRSHQEEKCTELDVSSHGVSSAFTSVYRDTRQKENAAFNQQPSLHHMSNMFSGEQNFPDTKSMAVEWEQLVDSYMEEKLKESMPTNCFQSCNDDYSWLCEDIYNQL